MTFCGYCNIFLYLFLNFYHQRKIEILKQDFFFLEKEMVRNKIDIFTQFCEWQAAKFHCQAQG